jgi:hypothetical protein
MKDSWIGKVGIVLAVVLVAFNIYKGVTVQEIGIPGFTFKFNSPDAKPSDPSSRDSGLHSNPPSEIEVDGRVVDFDKGVLLPDAVVQLTIDNATVSQKTDSEGGFIFEVPQSASNSVATLEVAAGGFGPYNQHFTHFGTLPDVYLKHLSNAGASGGGASGGGASGGAAVGGLAGGGKGAVIGAHVNFRPTPEQIEKLKPMLPVYQKRKDFAALKIAAQASGH